MTEQRKAISRRDALKRGAAIGGTVLWATPIVQTVGMGRAMAQEPSDTCVASWADQVEAYNQGLRKDGTPVLPARANPANSLGAPNNTFVSLGYGGELIVRLEIPYYNGKNGEAIVVETSGGNPPFVLERATVEVSGSSAGPWVSVGIASNQEGGNPLRTEIPLDAVLGLPPIVRYIRIVDITNPAPHNDSSDGYDVNAVGVGCRPKP